MIRAVILLPQPRLAHQVLRIVKSGGYSRNQGNASTMVASAQVGTNPASFTPNVVLQGLEPTPLWNFFAQLSSIPRPSKHEDRVLTFLKEFAEARGLKWQQDGIGNICIHRPGSGGGEGAPPVIIQNHVDMVTEKNADVDHDFMRDPIRLLRDGDWITADGTTLGADNGMGACAALAVLDLPKDAALPPIEALFTVDEETGLSGAFQLDPSLLGLTGATMLNLDTEEFPHIYIGCAGGGDSVMTLDMQCEDTDPSGECMEVGVTGLLGGHSGIEIHEDRGNAVRLAAALADHVLCASPGSRLASLRGGDKRNAIPRECTAVFVVPASDKVAVENAIALAEAAFKTEFGRKERAMQVTARHSPSSRPSVVMRSEDTDRLLSLLLTLPHGVIKYSHDVDGLVETSSNVASVVPLEAINNGVPGQGGMRYRVQCSTRSSIMPALERTRGSIRRIGLLCGAKVEQDEAYPGWQPNPGADIVALARQEIAGVAGAEPEVKAIHAGLECGIIGEKLGGRVQSVSFGPTIRGAHSPDERVQISTVEPFFKAVVRILERLAEKRA